MPAKRGRPISSESNSLQVDRRRRVDRLRQQQRRQRQKGQDNPYLQVSQAQQEQYERIISLPSVEEEDAAATLLSLGMRKSPNIELPHDPTDAELQQSAEDVDEHDLLYAGKYETQSKQNTTPKYASSRVLPTIQHPKATRLATPPQ